MGDAGRNGELAGEREDLEVVLAGGDEAEEAAVGRDAEIAEGEVVKKWSGCGLEDGNFHAGRDGG